MGGKEDLSTINLRRFDPTPPPEFGYRVAVADGPDAGGHVMVDDASPRRLYVGGAAESDLRLSDRAVSRRHFAIELEGDWLRLEDLGSTNGTFVCGVRVRDVLLTGGETVRVGSTTLHVERQSAAPVTLSPAAGFGRLRGASREMRRLYPLCERLAASDVSVLIEGETGTGKEVLAECIHEGSRRAAAPFVVLDCTSVAPNLVESVLFGHERGAFTGATSPQAGVFEEAHGGTLFIDEIGDLDLSLQPKLLRALERSEVRRLGGARWLKVDVRVVVATRRNLDAEIEAGRFRDDLFHRLAVARIELPPLRARRGDVPVLVDELCKQQGASSDAIPRQLLASWEHAAWPGNVRELRNAVTRFLALGELPFPSASLERPDGDFSESVLASNLSLVVARQRVVEDFERRYVERVLAAHGGNVSRAARASGIARRYFQILRAKMAAAGQTR
jgi:DNA-binding NtrC family response regulator